MTAAYVEARRQEILTAALTLFAEKGFERTSMADIAAGAGLSTGAVYRYFPNKSDLVQAVCGEGGGERIPGDTAAEAVQQLSRRVDPRRNGRSHARLVAQIWGNAAIDEPLASSVTRRHAEVREQLADLISRERPDDDERPSPSGEAEVVLAALIGYAALTATEAPVDQAGFARALSRLLD